MSHFLWFLFKSGKWLALPAIAIGVVSGGANAKLIALIHGLITTSPQESRPSVWVFVAFMLLALATSIVSQWLMTTLSIKIAMRLRLNMCREIADLPLRRIETAGSSRFIAAFTQDIPSISNGLTQIPGTFTNFAIVVGCLVYLGILSVKVLFLLVLFIAFAVISYLIPERISIAYMAKTRESWDQLLQRFNALIYGIKELKLHRSRRNFFLGGKLSAAAQELHDHAYTHSMVQILLGTWVQFLYFVFIGTLLFLLPRFGKIEISTLVGFTLVVLYIRTPIMTLMSLLPTFRNAGVAFDKIRSLNLNLIGNPSHEKEVLLPSADEAQSETYLQPIREIRLERVTYIFKRKEENENFTLGPLDYTISGGELIFIIGGNGSGKTTLAKILTGLYRPDSGTIHLNGIPVTDENRDDFRQNYTAIFNDFYLFDELAGFYHDSLDERARSYLKKLQLDHKLTITDGRFSTTKLSLGQRKRLALLVTYLEDRPVYLFDEWAADQDPEFKEVFYHTLLPELKKKGKTIFVISHDDRYFHCADRILKMEEGHLISTD